MAPHPRAVAAVVLAACAAITMTACSSASPGSGKTYIIASDNAFAPFEYLDTTTNTYVGVDMDILAAVAADQGFKYTVQNIGFDPQWAPSRQGRPTA